MKSSRLMTGTCLLFFGIASSFAQGAPDTSLTANPIYQKNCAKCHGKTAEGRHFGGPSLVSEKVGTAPADDLLQIVTNGKGRMPKYGHKLTPEEIDRLIRQIKDAPRK